MRKSEFLDDPQPLEAITHPALSQSDPIAATGRDELTLFIDVGRTETTPVASADLWVETRTSGYWGRWRQIDSDALAAVAAVQHSVLTQAEAGQKNVQLDSVADYAVGDHVLLYDPNDLTLTEFGRIASISGTTITLVDNLETVKDTDCKVLSKAEHFVVPIYLRGLNAVRVTLRHTDSAGPNLIWRVAAVGSRNDDR